MPFVTTPAKFVVHFLGFQQGMFFNFYEQMA